MSEPEAIFAEAVRLLEAALGATAEPAQAQDLAGRRLLVSAGGTREPIDPVRYLGNRSSGRQGVAVAAAAAARGAEVTLVIANVDRSVLRAELGTTPGVTSLPVGSAAELERVMHREAHGVDVVVMAAAVADYRVADVAEGKIRKEDAEGEPLVLTLVENPDILRGLVEKRRPGQVIVGFAAETTSGVGAEREAELLERGRRKLARKGCDLLAVNAVGWDEGFERSQNELFVLRAGGELETRAAGSKRETAEAVLDAVVRVLDEGPQPAE